MGLLHTLDSSRIGWIVFDDPELPVNLLSPKTLAQLRGAIDTLTEAEAAAIIVTSAKEKIFVAGADLNWLASLADASAAAEVSKKGQRLFEALSALPIPTICAINGVCAGGGLELALACRWRIASDMPQTRIGLPETTLGLIPAWGGTVRLPRLIGAAAAIEHIVTGELIAAAAALEVGLVDELVPLPALHARAEAAALRFAETGDFVRLAPQPVAPGFFADYRQRMRETEGAGPACAATVDVIERTHRLQPKPAFDIEAHAFGKIFATADCKERIQAFFASRNR
jgi:3-hydroxyacyl-CoA dehydrogenase/enoyl-CoA hydratase/3-hydroxybutyryl-CoA epimerase